MASGKDSYLEHAYAAVKARFPNRRAFNAIYAAVPDAKKNEFLGQILQDVANEPSYLEHAYAALKARFADRHAFEAFYVSVPDAKKDKFLRVASFYRFLVKDGDWHVQIDGSTKVIDYLTNSFKLVALFSLIESVSGERHIDFHSWLCSRCAAATFPIVDDSDLSRLHDEYKASFGSIRRCVAFFKGLSIKRQDALCASIRIDDTPLPTIESVARFLYELRSSFVHDVRLALDISDRLTLSKRKNKTVKTKVSLGDLLTVFEEGLLTWFGHEA